MRFRQVRPMRLLPAILLVAAAPSVHAAERALYLYAETAKFFPTPYQESLGHLDVDWYHAEDAIPDDNIFCLRLTWDFHTWAGLCWLNDDSNWAPPGMDLSGATAVRFRAKRDGGGGSQIKVEYINNSHLRHVPLTTEWQAYELPIVNPGELVDVWSLFSVVLEPGSPEVVCLDNIQLIFDRPTPPLPTIEISGSIFDQRGARLLVNGQEHPVVGAGYGVRNSEHEGYDLTTLLPELHANCIRTWGNECTFQRLDQLATGGAYALVGYWLPTSEDFAPLYMDPLAQQALRNDLRCFMETFRSEPNVLGWLLGNEVYLSLRSLWTPAERIQFFEFYEELVQHAKTIDPLHPVGYAGASLLPIYDMEDQYAYLPQHVPSLDFYGSNMYGDLLGGGLTAYLEHCATFAYDKPIILTEFGPRGWWEIPGGIEAFNDSLHDGDKATEITGAWNQIWGNYGVALGGCVFHWIDKREAGGWMRWGIFGGAETGDISRNWRAQAYAAAGSFADLPGSEAPAGDRRQAGPSITWLTNPVADVATMDAWLGRLDEVTVQVYDVQGRLRRSAALGVRSPGWHRWMIDTAGLPGGIYAVRLNTRAGSSASRLTLVR